ncbi:energy transducer TonB [Niastella caeni]|uniref:Energy transducer TonB n=1 Tax=Niastella caeni TaxID=2569763 RepID=A0A4S8HKU9_9BACT|nr:energy transducer TonB [Niastella caeni]THU33502.1 energy transducer TonB [Niastella caeni]
MKKLISVISLLLCIFQASAQNDSTKKQVITTVKSDTTQKTRNAEGALLKVEVESEFPGGIQGWQTFLHKNLTYPKTAISKRIQGMVILRFIVCTDGTVCDIEAISGPEELRQSAIDVLKKTPNWIPAMQDGKQVKSYKKQALYYLLDDF